jgi:hypothetical protein
MAPGRAEKEEPMKSIGKPLLMLILVATLLGISGCDKHYVDVYINENGKLVLMDNDPGKYIETLFVFPGDFVVFNNMSGEKVTLGFTKEGLFGTTTEVLEPNTRIILEVQAGAPPDAEIAVAGDGWPSTGPKVKVGEGP